MRIVNNKIFIKQGETPTYSANIINKVTGAPFVITADMSNFGANDLAVQFVVKPNSYIETQQWNINRYLLVNDLPVFDDSELMDYVTDLGGDIETGWDDSIAPPASEPHRVYLWKDNYGVRHYAYYDWVSTSETYNTWVDYDFIINVTFTYNETSVMEAKKYNYEIVLLGGTFENGEFTEIVYKKPLLDLTEFTVEGSIGD